MWVGLVRWQSKQLRSTSVQHDPSVTKEIHRRLQTIIPVDASSRGPHSVLNVPSRLLMGPG